MTKFVIKFLIVVGIILILAGLIIGPAYGGFYHRYGHPVPRTCFDSFPDKVAFTSIPVLSGLAMFAYGFLKSRKVK